MKTPEYEFDAFISHAVEDKIPIANELYERLKQKGFRIWYSGQELKVGDRLTAVIEEGLARSRYGIVIFSPTYMRSKWTLREFYSLLTRQKDGHTMILPVLYDITPEELALEDLVMADMFSVAAGKGIDHVVEVLSGRMRAEEEKPARPRSRSSLKYGGIALIVLLLAAAVFLFWKRSADNVFSPDPIEAAQGRVLQIETKASDAMKEAGFTVTADYDSVIHVFTRFRNIKSQYRNEFNLVTIDGIIHHKKNVAAALKVDLDTITPLNRFTMSSPVVYQRELPAENGIEYFFLNNAGTVAGQGGLRKLNENAYSVEMTYQNNIRAVTMRLLFPKSGSKKSAQPRKRFTLTFYALPPAEVLLLENRNGTPVTSGIDPPLAGN